MNIEIGIEWNTLELWMVITSVDGDYSTGYRADDGTIELDCGKTPSRLEAFADGIIKEREDYIWSRVVEDCAQEIDEKIAEYGMDQAEFYSPSGGW